METAVSSILAKSRLRSVIAALSSRIILSRVVALVVYEKLMLSIGALPLHRLPQDHRLDLQHQRYRARRGLLRNLR